MPVNIGTLVGTLQLNAQGFLGSLTQVSGQFTAATQRIESQASKIKSALSQALTVATGIQLAHVFESAVSGLRDVVTESIKLGHEAKIQESAFAALTQSVGIAGDAMVRALQRASGETVNISDVMVQAGRAIVQGFQPDQIVTMMEVARQQSKLLGQSVQETFNQIAQSIASGNTRALRPIAGLIDVEQAVEDFARKNGQLKESVNELGRTQAIYEAFMRRAADSTQSLTRANAEQKELVERLAASWKQLKEDVGSAINAAGLPALRWLQSMSEEFAGMGAKAEIAWRVVRESMGSFGSLFKDLLPTLKAAGAGLGGFFLGLLNGVNVVLIPIRSLAAGLSALVEGDFSNVTARMTAAFNDQVAATERSSKALLDQVDAFGVVAKASDEGERSLKKFQGALGGLGTNAGVNPKDMFKPAVLDVEKLGELFAGLRQKWDEAFAEGSVDENAIIVPFVAALDKIKGMTPAVKAAAIEWVQGFAAAFTEESGRKKWLADYVADAVQGVPADAGDVFQTLRNKFDVIEGAESVFGVSVESVTAKIEAQKAAVTELLALGYSPMSDQVQLVTEDIRELNDEQAQAQRMEGIGAAVREAFAMPDASIDGIGQVIAGLNASIQQMKGDLAAGGEGVLEGLPGRIAALRPDLEQLIAVFGEGSQEVREFREEIGAVQTTMSQSRLTRGFTEIAASVEALNLSASEGLGLKIAAITQEIRTLLAQNDPTLEDRIKALSNELEGLKETAETLDTIKSVFSSIGNAFTQTVIGIQRGNQTIAQGFQNMAQNVVLSITETLINKGFKKLADAFSDMIDQMITKQAVLAAVSIIGKFFSASTSTYQTDYTTQNHATGGIITRPTRILAGEEGPEAIIPLDRHGLPNLWEDQAGGMAMAGGPGGGYGGPAVEIHINHDASVTQVEHQEQRAPDGRVIQNFIVTTVKEGIGGGQFDRDLMTQFGLARRGVSR